MKRLPVVFLTTTFAESISNGPGLYTQNLWSFFSSSSDFDFRMVVAETHIEDSSIHCVERPARDYRVYAQLEALAKQVLAEQGNDALLHVNIAHMISPSFAKSARALVQINDTEVCEWVLNPRGILRAGLRRSLGLFWRRRREKSVARMAQCVICNSEFTRRSVQRAYRLRQENVRTIYKAVPLHLFHRARDCNQLSSSDERTVAFVGSNWHLKGLDILFRALAINEKLPNSEGRLQIKVNIFGAPPNKIQIYFKRL